jgi:hypothetical protein
MARGWLRSRASVGGSHGCGAVRINVDIRDGANDRPEVWVKVDELLNWLDAMEGRIENPITRAAAQEMRGRLFEALSGSGWSRELR